MNKKKYNISGLFLAWAMICLPAVVRAEDPWSPRAVQRAKQAIVSINRQVAVSAYEMPSNSVGDPGAVVDTKEGYILTVASHAGLAMAATFTVAFFNGATAEAKVRYSHPWGAFALLQVDPASIPPEIQAVPLQAKTKVGDPIFTVAPHQGGPSTVHSGKIFDTNVMEVPSSLPQHYIGASMDTKVSAPGSLIFNAKGEGVALNLGSLGTANVGLHLDYVCRALKALKQKQEPTIKHVGALMKPYSLADAVRYDKLPPEKQKAYTKRFPAGTNRILAVDAVLPGSPAAGHLLPGDLIWAMDGKMVGPDLVDLDLAMSRSLKDSLVLTIFRQGAFHEIPLSLYDLNAHRITEMVEFGGATFFAADDKCSRIGGVAAKTLTFCVAQPNTIFRVGFPYRSYGDTKFFGLQSLAINGEPIQTLDALMARIPQLMQEKYFTMSFVNIVPIYDFILGQDRCKANVEYDATLAPPRVWRWNPSERQWESQPIGTQ